MEPTERARTSRLSSFLAAEYRVRSAFRRGQLITVRRSAGRDRCASAGTAVELGLARLVEPAADITPPPTVSKFIGWTIENRAIAAIAQMAALAPDNWRKDCDPGDWKMVIPRMKRELTMLRDLMGYRDGVMSEAIAQATGIIPYFQGLAGFTAASHPETTNLCIIALNSDSSW